MVIVQGPVLGRIGKKYSSSFLTVAGSIILETSFILLMSGNEIIIYLAAIFFAIGNGVMWPSVLTILSIVAGAQYQDYVQEFASCSGSLASIIGLLLGGIVYELAGAHAFLVSAIIIYAVFFLSLRLLSFEKTV